MGDRQGAKQPVKQPGPSHISNSHASFKACNTYNILRRKRCIELCPPAYGHLTSLHVSAGAAGYAGLHESRHQKAPLPSQLGGKVSSSQVLAERRTSSETGAAFSNTPVKGLDLKGSEKLSQVISGSPHHHQPMQSPRGKPNSDPHHNPYVPRPASRAMRDIYHQADRPMSRGLKEMDTHIRPMSRGRRERDTETRPMSRGMRDSDTRPMSRGGPTMGGTTTNMRSQLARASLTQDKFNRAGGATPVSRPDGSTGALSSMPPNLFQPPPTAALGDRILNKELSSSMMTQDPGCPGSPLGSRGEMRPPPPAGMRGALSWGVGPNAYEVDGRPGTRGGGPSCELEGSARPGTRGGRPASRMRGDSSGPLPQLQLAPLDGMDPPPIGKSLPEGAYPPPSSQGSRGAGRGLPLPSPGGGGKKPTPQTLPPGAMVGGSQSFVRASV